MSIEQPRSLRIDLRRVAEHLAISERQLARSVSASMSRGAFAPPIGGVAVSAPAPPPPPKPADTLTDIPSENDEGNRRTPPVFPNQSRPIPIPRASAPIAIGSSRPRNYGPTSYGGVNDEDFHETPEAPGTNLGQRAMLGTSPSVRNNAGMGASVGRFAVGSMLRTPMKNASFVAASFTVPSSLAARHALPPSTAALAVPDAGSSGSHHQIGGTSPNGSDHSGVGASTNPLEFTPAPRGVAGRRGQDIIFTKARDGQVMLSLVPREDEEDPFGVPPTAMSPTRKESRLAGPTRKDSRLGGGESASLLTNTSVAAPVLGEEDHADEEEEEEEKRRVHFPMDPISKVTIFETTNAQVVLQVRYRRPGWCLVVGAAAAVLRGLAWTLICRVLWNKLRVDPPDGQHWNDDNVLVHMIQDTSRAVAIATRLGFEVYGGCAVLFAIAMLVLWRPTRHDLRSLSKPREKKRLAIAVVCGAVSRVTHVISLGLAISAVFVGIHHALPLVWGVAYKSLRKNRYATFADMIAAGVLMAAIAVLLAGDMSARIAHWQVVRKWVALPLVVFSSAVRALQRQVTKSLKAHFSFRIMLLFTMCADAVCMLVAALIADKEVITRIVQATSDEMTSSAVAIVAMTLAVLSDVVVARYFDMISGMALTALTLPAAVAFFRAFDLTFMDIGYIMVAALGTILSTAIALGSGEINRRTRNVIMAGFEDNTPQQPAAAPQGGVAV